MMMYLRLGALAAFLALAALAFWYRGNAIDAEADAARARADLATAVAVNKANEETIGRMRADDAVKDALLAKFADDVAKIGADVAEATADIGELKDANEDIRAYLGGVVPDALELRLNR